MKKILALTLVLVMALGMMVPASAASAKVTKLLITGYDVDNEYALRPGDEVTIDGEYILGDFEFNDAAKDALAAAKTTKGAIAVLEKVAGTIEPRYRSRKGGEVFKTDIDVELVGNYTITVTQNALNTGIGSTEFTEANGFTNEVRSDKSKFNRVVDSKAWDKDTKAAVKKYFAELYDEAELKEIKDNYENIEVQLVLETINPFVSVKEIEYEIDIYFLIDGKRTDDAYYYTLFGDFANEVTEVDDDTWDVDSYKGQVIDALEYVSDIAIRGNYEFDINANVKMAKEKLIYFYVTTESEMADEPVFDRYPSIEVAFKVYQVGLNSYSGNFISMDGVDSSYYVYGKGADGGLKYLGRGGEMLPLSAKYYISTMKLDLTDDEPVDEIPVDVPTVVDDYNPSTGI